MSVLEELEGTIQTAAERFGPAVIGLGQGWGRGSGFVIDANRILTNAHNLRGDEVTVTFHDGRRETGPVLALANPGGRGLRVTPGFVSSTMRRLRGPRRHRSGFAIEHTAPLPRGSSGGPLLDR